MAKLMLGEANFLVLDRYFLNKLTDKIVELHPDRSTFYEGIYKSYVKQQKQKECKAHV